MSSPTEFRNRIEDRPDATYLPEKDRYHLYVSYACPFAHRCLATVYLKGLQDIIGVSVVHPVYQRTRPNDPNDEHIGWTFADPATAPTLTGPSGKREYSSVGAIPDSINGATYIRDLYDMVTKAPVRYTVPVLWDKKTKTIVNNETADIVQMLNTAFQSLVPDALDLFPKDLQSEIDAADEWIQNEFFGNTFKAAFAPTEDVYQESIKGVFPSLDRAEKILSSQRFLVGKGDRFTEADLRFFVGLIHFGVFSLESNTPIPEYPNVANYLRDLYQHPALKPSVNINHIKLHYESARKFKTDESLPSGKDQDLTSPHDRDRFPATAWVKH